MYKQKSNATNHIVCLSNNLSSDSKFLKGQNREEKIERRNDGICFCTAEH